VSAVAERTSVYGDRKRRALELGARFDFVAEPMRLAAALMDAQDRAYVRALDDRPSAADLVAYIVRASLPDVMNATMTAGTEVLREAVLLRFHEGDLAGVVNSWLAGDPLSETDEYLARAAAAPVLEALPELGASLRGEATDERRCPACGGLPQLAIFDDTGESLLTAQRRLLCSRCATEWTYARMTCVSCRETEAGRMPILADETRLPHLRVDACDTCRSYLVTVDVRREPGAVPLIDEIAALPLDLLAAERGYKKIARNVMGF
jgi:formate dehydrogenase accessory protein FdhE